MHQTFPLSLLLDLKLIKVHDFEVRIAKHGWIGIQYPILNHGRK